MNSNRLRQVGYRISTRVHESRRTESGSSTWQAVLLVITVVILGS